MNNHERILQKLLEVLAGDDGRQTTLPEVRRPSGTLARYNQAPPTFWQRLFGGDPYSRLTNEHEYRRFRSELEAETTAHKMDIDQSLALKKIKQDAERGAYQNQAELWQEVEELANLGMADITRASKFRELVQLVESLDLDPLQQQFLIGEVYRRFHAKPEDEDDAE